MAQVDFSPRLRRGEKSRLELIREKHPGTWRDVAPFRPVMLDDLAEKRVQSPDTGYDVRRYPYRIAP